MVVEWRHIEPDQSRQHTNLFRIIPLFAQKIKQYLLALDEIVLAQDITCYVVISTRFHRKEVFVDYLMTHRKIVVQLRQIVVDIPRRQQPAEIMPPIDQAITILRFQNII